MEVERENTTRTILTDYSVFWQLNISKSVSKIIVFLVLVLLI